MSRLKKALEKAKEAREEYIGQQERSVEQDKSAVESVVDRVRPREYKPLKPQYHLTQVTKCDADFLRRNRVISVCTEDEADRFKILRTQILNTMHEEGKNTLLVTSANPLEGKTLIALNLAISFSHQFDKTILLVDADLRKPSIHKYLGLDDGAGLSDLLTGKAQITDTLVNPGMDRLVIMRGGTPHTNSAELLGSPKMHDLMDEMKSRYPERFIIFDSAPVLTSADPLVFANMVDGIVIVAEAEKTKAEDIRKVLEMLNNKPIIGTVLNKVIH